MKYYETYEDENYVYLVMEYCPGKDLFEILSRRTKRNRALKEDEVKDIMHNLFLALGHCHSQNIAHRDLKPENIVIGREGQLKLIDFGLAQKFDDKKGKNIGKMVGTPYYVAPEAIEGHSSMEGDLWSLGVMIIVLLSGSYPFPGNTPEEIRQSITDRIDLSVLESNSHWQQVTPEGKEFVKTLLQIDPKKRISVQEAIEHKWFQNVDSIKRKKKIRLQQYKLSRNSTITGIGLDY